MLKYLIQDEITQIYTNNKFIKNTMVDAIVFFPVVKLIILTNRQLNLKGAHMLDLSVKDLIQYKEKVITYDNLVEITIDDYTEYKLQDYIDITNFSHNQSILLTELSLATQNKIGLRFMEFDGFIKNYFLNGFNKQYFYKNKVVDLFKEVIETKSILYSACKQSEIPEVLYTKFNNKIKTEANPILIPNNNYIPILYEVSISYRDTSLNKDVFLYYNLTFDPNLEIEFNPSVNNLILSITPITIEVEFNSLSDLNIANQIQIRYDPALKYFYYYNLENGSHNIIPNKYLQFKPISKKYYHYAIKLNKTSTIISQEAILGSSFRYNNSTFDDRVTGYFFNVLEDNYSKNLFLDIDSNFLKAKILELNEPLSKTLPEQTNLQFYTNITSGYEHCEYIKTATSEELPNYYKQLINYIDIEKISDVDLNYLILVYFYKINKNSKNKSVFAYRTYSLLDVDLNNGKFTKEMDFKKFFVTQFNNYLKLNTSQVPFSGNFHSAVKNYLQTKSFNIDYISEEVYRFVELMNTYYSQNFRLINVEPIETYNGVYSRLTIKITISINQENVTLELITQS
jgi:hypothetical protein